MQSMKLRLPIKLHNPLNGSHGHWAAIAKRRKQERNTAYYAFPHGIKLPVVVTLTRIAPRLFDDDNLGAAFKSVRDGIADKIGVDDGSKQIKFKYAQRRGKVREYAVEVEFAENTDTTA